jgi:N-methylhydantoinase A
VARDLDIPRVVVPTVASVLSALGHAGARACAFEAVRSHVGDLGRLDDAGLRSIFEGLEREAGGRLRGWFDGPSATRRSAEMRYGEQVYEIDVPLDDLDWAADGLMARVAERFPPRHEESTPYLPRPGQERSSW